MTHKVNWTQALFLFFFGLYALAGGIYTLVRGPLGPRSLLTVVGIVFSCACIYVGIRYKRLIATAPRRIEQLVYVGAGLTTLSIGVSIVLGPSPSLVGVPSIMSRVLFGGFLLGVLAGALVIWLAILKSVQFQASLERERDAAAGSA
jgi:hypothetical protein